MSKCLFLFVIALVPFRLQGQPMDFQYARNFGKLEKGWKKLVLPQEIFHKLQSNGQDLRIIGITNQGDTVEAPFLAETLNEKKEKVAMPFEILNRSHTKKEWFYTFKIKNSASINEIECIFRKGNFDGIAKLEGSADQKEWFIILENSRLLSIENPHVSYQFNRLLFPESNYFFYRLRIQCPVDPGLENAQIRKDKSIPETRYPKSPFTWKETRARSSNQTRINITFDYPVPLSYLNLEATNTTDYFRTISILTANDSIKAMKGKVLNFNMVFNGIMSSLEKNEFHFETKLVKWVEIRIENENNEPLHIRQINASSAQEILKVRIAEAGIYKLVYGNEQVFAPEYDLAHFSSPSADSMISIQPGTEIVLKKKDPLEYKPWIEDKAWFWSLIVVTMALMVWFSVRMVRQL